MHVLVDTLGSIGVIISSFLIVKFEWYFFDPLCSLFIAISIFFTTIPLTKSVVNILMLSLTDDSPKQNEIEQFAQVKRYNYWESNEGVKVATLQCIANINDQIKTFSDLFTFFSSKGCSDITIEVHPETV